MESLKICNNKRCQKEIVSEYKYCPYCGADQTRRRRTRRANGEGCIYALPNGKYKLDCVIGYDVDDAGKLIPQRITGTYTTRKAALEALSKLKERKRAEIAQGQTPKKRALAVLTLAEAWEIYEASRVYDALSRSQKEKLQIARRRVEPLSAERMTDILLDDMQDLLDATVSTYYPAKDIRTVLSHCYKVAIKREVVHYNKASYLELPLLHEEERKPFTRDDLTAFTLDWKHGHHFTGYILIMCYAGLRPGELMTQQLADIHLEEQYMIGGGKTAAGTKRTIPLADILIPVMTHFLKTNKNKLLEMNKDTFYQRYWETIERLEVSHLSPYSCRHTYMTELARAGVQPGIITAAGGHTDYQTTLRYTHIPIKDLVEAANKIGQGESTTSCELSGN